MNKHQIIKYSYKYFFSYYNIGELNLDKPYCFITEINCNITVNNILRNICIDTPIGIKRFLTVLEVFFIDFYFNTINIFKIQEMFNFESSQNDFVIDKYLNSKIYFYSLINLDAKRFIQNIMILNCERAERRNFNNIIKVPIFFSSELINSF